MLKAVFSITALTLTFATSSHAVETPKIDNREAKQEQRIDQGIRSGALTPKEEAKLDAGQAKVARMEEKAKADGSVTKHERMRIKHEQNVQDKRIHNMKHNEAHTH
ncbi:MAG: hypothetical protein ABL875_03870 [Candidatus Nitrotoga sp.]